MEELTSKLGNKLNLDESEFREGVQTPKQELALLQHIKGLMDQVDKLSAESGVNKWFVPGTPFGIDSTPKHKVFFDAGSKYNERLFMAANRCFLAGTEVWMANGDYKAIEDVVEGDIVLAFDTKLNRAIPSKVTKTFKNTAINCVKVTGKGGSEVFTTSNHEFYSISQRGVGSKKPLETFQYWDKAVLNSSSYIPEWDSGWSADIARLYGYLIGDGSFVGDCVRFTNNNENYHKDVAALAEKHFGLHCRRYGADGYYSVKNGVKGQNNLINALRSDNLWRKVARDKHIPAFIRQGSLDHAREFYKGLMATDGWAAKSGKVGLTTTSDVLAKQFQILLTRFGVRAHIEFKKSKNPRHADKWDVVFSSDSFKNKLPAIPDKPYTFRGTERRAEIIQSTPKVTSLDGEHSVYCIQVEHSDHLFIANGWVVGNSGKSVAGAFEASCHATGVYPSWWTGRRFDKPTHGWCAGSTARATRDTCQKELIGPIGAWGTGMIPKEKLGKYWSLAGVPQGIDIIQVRHVTGGWSTIGFKNYEQPIQAFYGTAMHWIWADEESPHDRYNEMLIRTMTTDGIIFTTFTPLQGLTPMVVRFLEKADYLAGARRLIGLPEIKDDEAGKDARLESIHTHKAVVQASWDDAPWLSEASKQQMAADTEPHLLEARRNGYPSMGSGSVFPINLESIMVTPFKIPPYYKKMFALDVGWNVTAALWAALDPQTDVLYIYDEYYGIKQPPSIHAAAIRGRGEWIPGVIDPASRGRSQGDGKTLISQYKNLGLNLAMAANARDAGISALWNRMSSGSLKVFSNLPNFAKEFVLYRRNLNGNIIDENDHLMDAFRYVQNNLIRAKSIDQLSSTPRYTGAMDYKV